MFFSSYLKIFSATLSSFCQSGSHIAINMLVVALRTMQQRGLSDRVGSTRSRLWAERIMRLFMNKATTSAGGQAIRSRAKPSLVGKAMD